MDVLDKHIHTKKNEYDRFIKDLESINIEYIKIEDKSEIVKEYIQTNSKDEKLIELLPLLKKNIEEYTTHNITIIDIHTKKEEALKEQSIQKSTVEVSDKETKELKAIFENINKKYIQLEANSTHDSEEEDTLRTKVKKQESLQKSYVEYCEYKKTISNEEESKTIYIKEQSSLKVSIETKQSLVNELKVHIQTLRQMKEAELLIKKYEDDRQTLKEGSECYLCGSTNHPYIENHTIVDTNKTINLIKEKELV